MANAKAKAINLLLYEGNLDGVISMDDTSWNSGELYSAPRESVDDLLKTDAVKKFGVYMLISNDMVYVGQASDLSRRITQHKVGKDWWESVVILTTKDDSLNHSDIDYLEYVLIEKAQASNHLDCENKKRGNPPKVDKFREVYLGQYLEEALFLMQLIGISVFTNHQTVKGKSGKNSLISTVDVHTKLSLGKRVKNEAISYLKEKGITADKDVSYSVLPDNGNYYWINPLPSMLKKEWTIILNDTNKMELIVLKIPPYSFESSSNGEGFKIRKDNGKLDLRIDRDTLVEKYSNVDFSLLKIAKVKY